MTYANKMRQPGALVNFGPARASASAPELGTGARSWGGYPYFPARPEQSSYSSMPDLTGVGPMPWWGGPTMGPMRPPFGFAGRGRYTWAPGPPPMPSPQSPSGEAMLPEYPVPGMFPTRGAFLPPYFPGMPRMMPGMFPGMMQGMFPGMMQGTFPGVMGGITPGMPMYAGTMPGLAPLHPQSPMMMAPPYFGGTGAAPYQAPQVTVLPQVTGSQPCIVTVPTGSGGGGYQPSFIPIPIPTPVPTSVPGGGGGGSTVIVTGNTQPPPGPYATPYQYPPPPQQHQSSEMADTAALMMMMQQIRSMMSARRGRMRGRRMPEVDPEDMVSPPRSPEAATPSTKKGKEKKAARKKGNSGILSPYNESFDQEKDVKSPAGEKEEEAEEAKDEKNEAGKDAPKTIEGTQESLGKGPDSNAPALSLSFPSTTALGQHVTTTEDETEAPAGYSFLGICCYAVFVAFLVCLVTLAVAPTLLRTLLDSLGLVTREEKKPGAVDRESDNTNETQPNNAFASVEGSTEASFFDLAETFGEIGIDDEFRDGEFAARILKTSHTDSIFDWLEKVGLNPGLKDEFMTTMAPLPLPYFKKRLRNGPNRTVRDDRFPFNAGKRRHRFIHSVRDRSDAYVNAAGSSGRKTTTNNTNIVSNLTSTAMKTTSTNHNWGRSITFEPLTTTITASTKSPIRELIDNLLKRSHASTTATTLWPLQDRLPYLPKTVYFDWVPTQPRPTKTARRNRNRRRGKGITLSFRLPDVPTMDIGKIVFYKVFRDFGDEETTHV